MCLVLKIRNNRQQCNYVAGFRLTDWDDERHQIAKAYAAILGESLNKFIHGAIDEKLARLAGENRRLAEEIKRQIRKK